MSYLPFFISLVFQDSVYYSADLYYLAVIILVSSILLSVYIGLLSLNFYKRFGNYKVGLFGVPMIFISLLMGVLAFDAFTDKSDGWGAIIGAIFYLPLLGIVLIVTAIMTLVFINLYKKDKKHSLVYKMTGRRIDN